jgi:Asp-tRNA(Asn)/Glu-tRNA(Gln) amidotransferase A subunit family amidase
MLADSPGRVEDCLRRIDEWEPRVRAWAWLDRVRATGLEGVPVGIKDVIDTEGIPTENGSALHTGRVPERSAEVVVNLERAGFSVLGKTVTAELAFFQPGPTRNPWNLDRTPGGSSMGSAAAVACGMVPFAVGTQTNGSVIRPAAFCGVVGFKPTRGAVPGGGVLVLSRTLDQIGGFARSVPGAARLAAAMAGADAESWAPAKLSKPPRLAVVPTVEWGRAEPAMRERFEADLAVLEHAGASLSRPPLPEGFDRVRAIHRAINSFECARDLGPEVARAPERVCQVLRDFLAAGSRLSEDDYAEAVEERRRLVEAFQTWAEPYDGILTPPARGEAPGPETTGDSRFCTLWTLLGAPAITIPNGLGPAGLPLGLQLTARAGADTKLLAAAAWAEQQLPFPGLVGPAPVTRQP